MATAVDPLHLVEGFPAPGRLWRKVLAAAVMIALTASLAGFTYEATHADLQLINGLDQPVRVTVAGETIALAPHARVSHRLDVGPHHIATRLADGSLLEELDVVVPRFTDLVAYNVQGAAPLFAKAFRFTPSDAPPADDVGTDTVSYRGERFVTRDDVQYLFAEPPTEIEGSSDSAMVVHWQVDLAPRNR